ncbi:hypothetical protein OAI07_00885 [Akkermansiaceae bacterium]|nr:hypothetical protein [Akkermansiaceae bacterium]
MKKKHLVILTITASLFASCGLIGTESSDSVVSALTLPNLATKIEGEPNMVISPYKPYNKIDVKGYKTGDKVGDPSTIKADPATGKADMSTMKTFLLP